MLLNSHTALRSFRELQYDLAEFLKALDKINPMDSESSGNIVVEARWSDGSISVAPVFQIIKDLVGNLLPRLNIRRTILEPLENRVAVVTNDSASLVNVLAIQNNIGVSLKIEELGDKGSELLFTSCLIKNLEVDTLILDPDSTITDLSGISSILARETTVNKKISVSNNIQTDSLDVDTLDASKCIVNSPQEVWSNAACDSTHVRLLNSDRYPSKQSNFNMILNISGYPCLNTRETTDMTTANKTTIFVEMPKPEGDTYRYVPTPALDISNMLQTTPFAEDSTIARMMLYPKKFLKTTDTEYIIRCLYPVSHEKGYVIQVKNSANYDIKVCNCWKFLTIGDSTGFIKPVSYVVLPAYSSIDFIFDYETSASNHITAYMMPTKVLSNGDSDD